MEGEAAEPPRPRRAGRGRDGGRHGWEPWRPGLGVTQTSSVLVRTWVFFPGAQGSRRRDWMVET